jgi:hypothetical protein
MKVYLDDVRQAPEGWHQCVTAWEVIDLFNSGEKITHLSLDHDLGPEKSGTGYDVCLYLMEKVFENPSFPLPHTLIHSANPVGVQHMNQVLSRIYSLKL